jgi:DNA-binding response OmpR family regulator
MLTYIVEDDSLKAGKLLGFLTDEFPGIRVEAFGSFHSGLRAIESKAPELVILDMTLPTFDRLPGQREGRLRPLGGYDLMRKLRLRRICPKVIIVTQLETFGEGVDQVTFGEMTARCEREFPEMFVGSVYFRQGASTWHSDLAVLLEHVGVEGVRSWSKS